MQTLETALTHFRTRDVQFARRGDTLHFAYEMEQGIAACMLSCYPGGVHLVIDAGPKCPHERIDSLARFVLAANFGLWGGRFDLNQHTGYLCYTQSFSFGEGDFSEAMLDAMVSRGLCLYDRYMHGAMSVMFGEVDPIEAVALCERPNSDSSVSEDSEPEEPSTDREWVEMMEHLMGMEEVDPDAPDPEFPDEPREPQPSLWDEPNEGV